MGQIFSAIIGITLVLCAVFVPMTFFGGSVGAVYRQFSVTLVLTMLLSVLMALTLTPAMCATVLKPIERGHAAAETGLLGWFNRRFTRASESYVSGVQRILNRPLRWLVLYGVICASTAWLFPKLPGSFLPDEDQGYFISIVQLPPGASRERTQKVLEQAEEYFLKQPEVDHVIGVLGFSFFGRGQNAALAFVKLKDWSLRKEPGNSVQAVIQRANMFLFSIKSAFALAVNVPPIPELGAVGGFDFRLQDRSGQGREALLNARNMMLGLASGHPGLASVRPEGQEIGRAHV